MRPYLDLLRHVLEHGERRTDRTGTGTLAVFGAQTRYDLREGFPLVTTKKVLFPAVVRELLWFLRGSTNIHDDLSQHTPIWDAWADAAGELGPVYGHQWRHWGAPLPSDAGGPGASVGAGGAGIDERSRVAGRGDGSAGGAGARPRGIDQISEAIATIKRDPSSRRIIVSAWNVADVPRMKLPPCHALFQFYVHAGQLDCQLYQRSADLALGVPFNIASYALLTAMIAKECGLVPRFFVHTFGDAHIYLNHVEGVKVQLAREPFPLPRLVLADKPVLEQRFDDIALDGYQHHPFIKFPVAV
jgi:thymidylate synthase